jgi:hypothetical protein
MQVERMRVKASFGVLVANSGWEKGVRREADRL